MAKKTGEAAPPPDFDFTKVQSVRYVNFQWLRALCGSTSFAVGSHLPPVGTKIQGRCVAMKQIPNGAIAVTVDRGHEERDDKGNVTVPRYGFVLFWQSGGVVEIE